MWKEEIQLVGANQTETSADSFDHQGIRLSGTSGFGLTPGRHSMQSAVATNFPINS